MSDKELTGAALDRAVAERVMEWHQEVDYDYHPPQFNWVDKNGDYQEIMSHPDQLANPPVWSPSKDIRAAFQVEDRIAELNLQNDYIAHLWSVVGATRNGINFWTADNFKAFWLCVHATPEQRCRAALEAVGDKE